VDYPKTKGATPPDWMLELSVGVRGHALDEWERLVPLLESQLVMTEADWSELAHYCTLHGKIVASYLSGEFPSVSMLAELRKLGGNFGLTPATRARIPKAGKAKEENPFRKLGKGA